MNIYVFHNSPQILFLFQLLIILTVSKFSGFLLSKLGQPKVVGEITAGILLGPSILGNFFPVFSTLTFPQQSISGLKYISEIGLMLFMFTVGLELNLRDIKKEFKSVLIITILSISIPFILGILTAVFLLKEFISLKYSIFSFSLFLGISFCITAFPVLARIILERKLQYTKVGLLAMSSAALNDSVAWFLLSVILAYINSNNLNEVFIRLAAILLYLTLMFLFIKPFLQRNYHLINKSFTTFMIMLMLFSSMLTEIIGIHALFGSFIAGIIVSDKVFEKSMIIKKIRDISIVLFLPVFFALSGLRTSIGLLNNFHLWLVFVMILIIAILGKVLACYIASRISGLNWRDSLAIGILMNTRGLIELIILNIGYDLGILNPTLFTILVLMALTTTYMTGPLLKLVIKKM